MPPTIKTPEAHRQTYRNAMARVVAAVKIVTTDGAAGRAGMTVTSACSVCQDPPRLLVCLNTSASAHPVVTGNQRLALNILSEPQLDAAQAFAGKVPQEDRFDMVAWHQDEHGQPLIDDACASFSCSIAESFISGTHTVFLCDVVDAQVREEARPLVYFDRSLMPISSIPNT